MLLRRQLVGRQDEEPVVYALLEERLAFRVRRREDQRTLCRVVGGPNSIGPLLQRRLALKQGDRREDDYDGGGFIRVSPFFRGGSLKIACLFYIYYNLSANIRV